MRGDGSGSYGGARPPEWGQVVAPRVPFQHPLTTRARSGPLAVSRGDRNREVLVVAVPCGVSGAVASPSPTRAGSGRLLRSHRRPEVAAIPAGRTPARPEIVARGLN